MARHFPQTPITRLHSAVAMNCLRRIAAKRLHDANQVAIIAKAARVVLRNRMRPDFDSQSWRWHARIQISSRSTHPVADHDARAERAEACAATLRASYRGAGAGATDCT